VAVY